MNNIFNLKRFSWLFAKHTREHFKTYLMSIVVMSGILVILLGLVVASNDGKLDTNTQEGFFVFFLMISGAIFTSTIFAEMGDKKRAIQSLTLPVSHFERFLVAWLYSFLIFLAVFVICFLTIDIIILNIANSSRSLLVKNELMQFGGYHHIPLAVFLIFPVLHSIVMYGAIVFEKLHFVKTMFAFFIFAFLLALINKPMLSGMLKAEALHLSFFSSVSIREQQNVYEIDATAQAYYIVGIMGVAVLMLLWGATYFKLKEKQV